MLYLEHDKPHHVPWNKGKITMMLLMWQKILKFNLYDLKCLPQYRHFIFRNKTSETTDIFRTPLV